MIDTWLTGNSNEKRRTGAERGSKTRGKKQRERARARERKKSLTRYITDEVCGRGTGRENKTQSDRKITVSLVDWRRKEIQKVEIRERDRGELVSVPVVHEVNDFTITKGKIEIHKQRERGKERGSCLVSAPQPLSQPLWEIDRTPSVCQTRLHTKHQTMTAACLSLSYNHANKQTNIH